MADTPKDETRAAPEALSGDEHSSADGILLSGDAQTGTDKLLLRGVIQVVEASNG